MFWLQKASPLKFMKFSLETNKWPANSNFLARRRSELMGGMSRENQRRKEFCPQLPFVPRVKADWSPTSGNGSSSGVGSPAVGIVVKQGTGVSASLAAIASSVATFGCCLPIGFAAALGAGAASAFFTTLRPLLLGVSIALIALGFWQQHRAKRCAVRGRMLGNVLLWAAVAVVLSMILLPQEIAAFIADWLGGAWKQ